MTRPLQPGQRDRVGGGDGSSGGSQEEACGNDKGRVTAICSGRTGHSLGFCLWPWDTAKTTSTGSWETGQTATCAHCCPTSSLVVHAEHWVRADVLFPPTSLLPFAHLIGRGARGRSLNRMKLTSGQLGGRG